MKGIYKITNLINSKCYVGMSNDVDRRFMEHKTAKNIVNRSTTLAKAFRKYGLENFSFEILEVCESELDLIGREMYYIELLKPEYNMNEGGKGNRGHRLSDEMKRHLSAKASQQWERMSEEARHRIISHNLTGPRKGHPVSSATREKLRLRNLGKKQSVETVRKRAAKISVSMRNNNNGNKQVVQILNGKELAVWESAVIAAEFLRINPSGITHAIKGDQPSAGGYQWKYFQSQ